MSIPLISPSVQHSAPLATAAALAPTPLAAAGPKRSYFDFLELAEQSPVVVVRDDSAVMPIGIVKRGSFTVGTGENSVVVRENDRLVQDPTAGLRVVRADESGAEQVIYTVGKTDSAPSGDDRPTVEVTTDEHEVNDAAIAALANDPTIYHRSGQLVRVVTADGKPIGGITRPIGAPRISALPLATLRERLSAAVKFVKWTGGDDGYFKPQHVPDFCVRAIASRGEWPSLRSLLAVVDAPTLRPDGTILDKPGWDESTGLLYSPNADFPSIRPRPTIEDARQARDDLLAVVSDFPFAGAEHQAAWLAFVLTPLARHAFDGPAPLFLVDANAPGSGKSLLCDLVSLIMTGRAMPRMANPADDAEASKTITSIALAADQLVMIDNVAGAFGCPSLDAALTSTIWKGRILSKNETAELPLTATWCASGNNVSLVGDIGRRICHVRLESDLANPEERQGFAHPDIKAWAVRERRRLIAAALTVLRAYCVAGRPNQGLMPWGSFEGWSDLVRQAVVWVGMADPGATRTELARQADGEVSILRQLLVGWFEIQHDKGVTGMTAATVLRELESQEADWRSRSDLGKPDAPKYDLLRTAINELCYTASSKATSSRSLGHKLRKLKGRRVKLDGDRTLHLEQHPNREGTSIWSVLEKKADGKNENSALASNSLLIERQSGHSDCSLAGNAGDAGFVTGSFEAEIGTEKTEMEKLAEIQNEKIRLERTGENPAYPANPATSDGAECVWSG